MAEGAPGRPASVTGAAALDVRTDRRGRLLPPRRRIPILTPPGSNLDRHYIDQRVPSRLSRWLRAQDLEVARAVRRAITLTVISPILFLAATRLPGLVDDPFLSSYGIAILVFTAALMYLAFVSYQDPAVAAPRLAPEDQPTVSVLVAVKDEVNQIEHCVMSVLNQTYRRLEVIVIDDASTDGTGRLLDQMAEKHDITVIHLPENVGKKRALTVGARVALGQFFVFTDSDCFLAEDAVEVAMRAMVADPGLGGLSGHGRALNSAASWLTMAQDVWYDTQFGITKAAEASFGSVSCVSGPLAVFRREAIESFLPAWAGDRFAGQEFRFATDRQLTAYVLGQEWMGKRVKAPYALDPLVVGATDRHWRVGYSKSARVWTNVPETFGSFIRQQIRWKKSFIRNLFFNGPWVWRRGIRPALFFYGHAIWVVAAPLMVFRHVVWAPMTGAWSLFLLYLAGISLKGGVWSIAHRVQNPDSGSWWLRAPMSVVSSLALSWLILYSTATLRRSVWHREPAGRGKVVVEVLLDDRDPEGNASGSGRWDHVPHGLVRASRDVVAFAVLAALFAIVLSGGAVLRDLL